MVLNVLLHTKHYVVKLTQRFFLQIRLQREVINIFQYRINKSSSVSFDNVSGVGTWWLREKVNLNIHDDLFKFEV